MKKLLLTTLTVFSFTAVAADFLGSSHNWNKGSSDPFKTAIEAAESGLKSNLAASMAWRDTGKMISEAKKLQASGKTDAALALAKKAHTQTVNAKTQMAAAKSAGPRF